ncbi:MAG TPA: hypothetical protein VFQ70_03130 [Candidatus Saccharimonadaceae bacterium]|nr:hypothetical protein [Candidatus Saccharimonadaceae bacterium]
MIITTTQKIIKIGTSRGVTIPAKDLRALGVEVGDEITVTFEQPERLEVLDEYAAFKEQYGETLKNLSRR